MAAATTSSSNLVESAKKLAAFQAVEDHLLPSFKYVGIGSGSTVVYVVEAIVDQGPDFYANMTFIPTGSQSKGLIRQAGLTLCNLDERPVLDGRPVALDVAFDGADEVDEDLNLIKGGGACLLQEKLVAIAAKTFVAVAGEFRTSCLPIRTRQLIPRQTLESSPRDCAPSGRPSPSRYCQSRPLTCSRVCRPWAPPTRLSAPGYPARLASA